MNDYALESAAQFLLAARRRGTPGPRIPQSERPANVDDALAIQARLVALIDQPVGGYKCSAPAEGRAVAYAPIFAPSIAVSSPAAVQATGGTARIEPEIAFVMARDLPPRAAAYSDEDVRDAVGEVRMVLELVESRYADPASTTFPEQLADFVSNLGLFTGPPIADPWQRKLEAFPLTIRAGESVFATRDGKHPDGHPLKPLHWLANYLASQGSRLSAGQIVTTGSYCGVIDAPLGKPLTFTYGDLGSLCVTLARA